MNYNHNIRFSAGLLAAILTWAILIGIIHYDALAMTSEKKEKQLSRAETMTKKTNPNIGIKFPTVTAKSLANSRESIPESAKDKVTLVTVAFLRKSQSQLDSWLEPFINKFGNREGITFYEVPMISSGYKFMSFMIDGGMRSSIPEEKHKHVVTMYGDVDKYQNFLNLDPRLGYAFLLDREGIIHWQGQGFASSETFEELFGMTEKLAQK